MNNTLQCTRNTQITSSIATPPPNTTNSALPRVLLFIPSRPVQPSHGIQPSPSSFHAHSPTFSSELCATKKELQDCQLFLTESPSSFKFEKRLNEDYKRNFTALEQKCKQDIQSMQKALNAQWHQYEQMVHTTSIKRIM